MATAKRKLQKLIFNPLSQKLVDFVNELQKLATNAFGIAAHAITEEVIYAKSPNDIKNKFWKWHIWTDCPEKELELNGLEAPG